MSQNLFSGAFIKVDFTKQVQTKYIYNFYRPSTSRLTFVAFAETKSSLQFNSSKIYFIFIVKFKVFLLGPLFILNDYFKWSIFIIWAILAVQLNIVFKIISCKRLQRRILCDVR